MCLIVKDQHRDVVEWIQHHRRLGAGQFYIWDHNSSVPLVLELHPFVNEGLVQYQYFRCCPWTQATSRIVHCLKLLAVCSLSMLALKL